MTSAAALAVTLAAAPAQATDRLAAEVRGESQIEAGSIPYVVGFFVILAIGFGIYLATDDSPQSP